MTSRGRVTLPSSPSFSESRYFTSILHYTSLRRPSAGRSSAFDPRNRPRKRTLFARNTHACAPPHAHIPPNNSLPYLPVCEANFGEFTSLRFCNATPVVTPSWRALTRRIGTPSACVLLRRRRRRRRRHRLVSRVGILKFSRVLILLPLLVSNQYEYRYFSRYSQEKYSSRQHFN